MSSWYWCYLDAIIRRPCALLPPVCLSVSDFPVCKLTDPHITQYPDFEGEKLTKIFRLICNYIRYLHTVACAVTLCHFVHLNYFYSVTYLQLASMVWLSGNVLDSINKVTLCWAQLVHGWVTILGWSVKHFGTETGSQVDSAWDIPLSISKNEYIDRILA